MARAKKSKSEAIRRYFRRNPEASAQAVAKSLKVTPGLVYNVRSKMNEESGGGEPTKKRGRKPASAANGDFNSMVAAAKLIKSCGGISQARQALAAAEEVASALQK